jgi:hypothetical protein
MIKNSTPPIFFQKLFELLERQRAAFEDYGMRLPFPRGGGTMALVFQCPNDNIVLSCGAPPDFWHFGHEPLTKPVQMEAFLIDLSNSMTAANRI